MSPDAGDGQLGNWCLGSNLGLVLIPANTHSRGDPVKISGLI
jgi:hypothetical protein